MENTIKEVKPQLASLGFGNRLSEHMFIGHYKNGLWQEPTIVPYGKLSLAPTTLALHYGQTVFEGMKAFRLANGQISIFRIEKHHARLNRSLQRMAMPTIPFNYFEEALTKLVATDADFVPSSDEGASLYIRPFVFATGETFGVKVSDTYSFIIFTGPVGAYYSQPVTVKVETEFIRAAEGGSGFAKCGGNYGAAFYPTIKANEAGFDQLLWTDSKYHEFIEESGTMNVMFVLDDVLVTPALSGTILEGVTRDSLLQLAQEMGIKVQERPISYKEIIRTHDQGLLQEAFGVGTAAVISPISLIHVHGTDYQLPVYSEESICFRLKERLNQIRTGLSPDTFAWNTIV